MKCFFSRCFTAVALLLFVFAFKAQAQPATGKLFIVGSAVAGGWTNPIPSIDISTQQFTKISATEYKIIIPLIGGGEYKFIDSNGYWGENWGIAIQDNPADTLGGSFIYGVNIAQNILAPSVSGNYVIDVNFNTDSFTVKQIVPSITPSFGSFGNSITITGAGFIGATAVNFGNSAAYNYTIENDSTIIAYIGYGASGNVAVTTIEGIIITIPGFIYVPPTLPTTGKLFIVGSAVAGGWANPIPLIDSAAQQFTKISATEYKITIPLVGGGEYKFIDSNGYWGVNWGIAINDNPADIYGSAFILHLAQNILAPPVNGTYTIDANFKTGIFTVSLVNPSPTIISTFTPTNGCPGTTITISGYNFTGATAVNIGGASVASYNVVNDNTIEAVVANENISGVITVFSPSGVAISRATFTIGSISVLAYVPNQTSNTVSVINTATNTVIANIPVVPVGTNPYGVSITPDGSKVYVTNRLSTTVSVINTLTNNVIATIPVGYNPDGIIVTPDGSKVYVANLGSDEVSVINTATDAVITTIPIFMVGNPGGPERICVTPDGSKVYVTTNGSYYGYVTVINTATNTVLNTIQVGTDPISASVTPDGTKVYVANKGDNSVSVINTATNAVLTTFPVVDEPSSLCVTPDGSKIYIASNSQTVGVFNTATNTLISTIPLLGTLPNGISVTPDGSKVYVTGSYYAYYGGNYINVINTATNTVIDTIPVGLNSIAVGNFIGSVIVPCQPVINSISKDSVCLNDVITVTGYFYGVDSVKFNGIPVPFAINSNTSLSVTLNNVGRGYLTVMDLGGIATSEKPLNVDIVPNFQVVPANFQLCGGNERQVNTTLKSPLGYEYTCSNRQTGDSITINAPGNYILNVKDTFGCKNSTSFTVTNYTPCGGYLEIHSDTVANYFGDTIHVKVSLKGGSDIFSCYGYLNFDNTHDTLLDSKVGSYLGTRIINQPPVVTNGQIDFGMTKESGQGGSNGDGDIYEFRFLLNHLPTSSQCAYDSLLPHTFPMPFTLTNLTVYNSAGLTPPSFNAISLLSDTTLCRYSVPVWPGDLNNDGVVNVADLLPIGYFYGNTGTARPNATLSWNAQPAILFGYDKTIAASSAFEVFADGNGDGKIDLADQASIGFNLSNVHTLAMPKNHIKIGSFGTGSTTPKISVSIPDKLIARASLPYKEVVSVNLGSTSLPLDNLYGVAFKITFNPVFVDTNNIVTDYSNSIFGSLNKDFINIEDFSKVGSGIISIGMTRYNTSTINATGGNAVNINFPILANAPNGAFTITATPIACNDKTGNALAITSGSDSVGIGYSLPVSLVRFNAYVVGSSVNIEWKTNNELNTSHFIIQHSTDGTSFTNIGNVKAIDSGANSYQFVDNNPANGTNYYRLQSVDKDGATSFSKVVSVQFALNSNQLSVYPNPAKGVVTIGGNHIASVQVIDNMGRVVSVQTLHDATNPTLALSSLPVGVYHLRIQTIDGNVSVIGFMKE